MGDEKSGWTISALADAAREALDTQALDQTSNRVRAVPDVRTIRYYASTGLIDRPLGFAGRTALYGERHLAQLVAIKRLQAQGATLDEIRGRLEQANPVAVRRIAGLTDAVAPSEAAKPSERGERRFWGQAPAPVELNRPTAHTVRAVGLGQGVSLVLGEGAALSADELASIAAAAVPLMKELAALGALS